MTQTMAPSISGDDVLIKELCYFASRRRAQGFGFHPTSGILSRNHYALRLVRVFGRRVPFFIFDPLLAQIFQRPMIVIFFSRKQVRMPILHLCCEGLVSRSSSMVIGIKNSPAL